MLFVITPEDNLSSLGPIPSNPVDLDISSFDIKEKTKFSSISGNSNVKNACIESNENIQIFPYSFNF